jgi:hypothetical protein
MGLELHLLVALMAEPIAGVAAFLLSSDESHHEALIAAAFSYYNW